MSNYDFEASFSDAQAFDATFSAVQAVAERDHAKLEHLDYANSGHTGFSPSEHTHTKSQITDFPSIPAKTSDLTNDSGFLTEHQSLSAYRTSSAQDVIDNTKVDKVTGKGLSTNDYTDADKTKVGNAITEHQSLANYYTKSETDSAISGHHDSSKQDSLVSGSNIKTINNNSILGSGDITISGGEPNAYLKSASVSGNTLTIINKDDSSVAFTPSGGGGDLDLSIVNGKLCVSFEEA